MYAYKYIYLYTYICIYIYVYVYVYIYMYICICVYMTPNNRKHLYRAPTRGRPHVGSASPHIPVLKVTRYAITCVSSKVVGVVESRAPDERYICIYIHIFIHASAPKRDPSVITMIVIASIRHSQEGFGCATPKCRGLDCAAPKVQGVWVAQPAS